MAVVQRAEAAANAEGVMAVIEAKAVPMAAELPVGWTQSPTP